MENPLAEEAQICDLKEENHRLREELSRLDEQSSRISQFEEQRFIDAHRFLAILANNRHGILLLNPAGVVVELVHGIFGYTPESVVGSHVASRMLFDSAARFRTDLEWVVQHPKAELHGEYELRNAEGANRWIEAVMTDRLSDPAVQAIVINYRDITESKLAEAKLGFLASIVESSDWAVISEDFTGQILSWNPGAVALYGYGVEEAIGQNISIIMFPEQIARGEEYRRRIEAGETIRSMVRTRRRKNGAPVDVKLKLAPIRDAQQRLIGCSHISSALQPDTVWHPAA
jgi:PAS domain S-box-containing protein